MGFESAKFRITVWRPAEIASQIFQYAPKAESAVWTQLDSRENLYQSVYEWWTAEDIWGGFKRQSDTVRIRALLVTKFDPANPAEQRSLAQLGDVLSELKLLTADVNALGWQDCESFADEFTQEIAMRANTAAALYNHLSWVFRTFRHLPGASITVR
jgi:hypothetical protein